MQLQIQSITLKVKPLKSADNRFKALLQTIGMYLYLWVNLVTLIRCAKNGAAAISQPDSTILSMEATIKPARKDSAQKVMQVIP